MSILFMRTPTVFMGVLVVGALTAYVISSGFSLFTKDEGAEITHGAVDRSSSDGSEYAAHLSPSLVKVSSNLANQDNVEQVKWIGGDATQIEVLQRWQAERGWYKLLNMEGSTDYETYSTETLKQLAEDGSLQALHQLAKGIDLTQSKHYLDKAAVLGSTLAFTEMSEKILIYADISRGTPRDIKMPVVIEALAYNEVSALRGDLAAWDMQYRQIEMLYDVTLTPVDKQLIHERATKIYQDLEAQRISLGLGAFDNTVPPIVKAYQKAMVPHRSN